MADISNIKFNNVEYDIMDAKCRAELEALIGSDTLAGDVDTIKEIQAFLAGIDTDDPTLFNQLKAINNRIDAIVAVSGTVDDALSSTSINPVQNKVIKGALDGKANKSELTVTAVTGDTTKKTIQLKSGTSQNVVVEHQDISGKQDKINDLATIRSGAAKGATSVQTVSVNGGTPTQPTNGNVNITIPSGGGGGYEPPAGGIPKTDLASGVQASLNKADSAIQGVKVNGTELTPDADKKVSISAVTGLQFDGSTHIGVVQLPEYVKKSDYDTAIAEYVKKSDYNTKIDDIYQSIPSDLADLADDKNHRVVTDAEKSRWNYKQDVISDLATIRSGAAAGATAVQPNGLPTKVSDLTNDAGYTTNQGTVTGISVNGGTAQQPTNGVVNLTVATGGDNDLVGLSDGTANDGAVVFTKRNGDTITLNLNHVHPQYQPLLTAGANITIAENAQTGEIVISSSGGGSAALIGVSFNGAPATVVNGVATITATIPANVSELNNDSGYAKYVLLADEAAYTALATKDSGTLYLIPE